MKSFKQINKDIPQENECFCLVATARMIQKNPTIMMKSICSLLTAIRIGVGQLSDDEEVWIEMGSTISGIL